MQDRKPERRVLAIAAVLTGLGMAALPTTGMAVLMPWVMQQGAYPVATAGVIQTAHTYGLILAALPMAALAARLGPRRGFLAALLALAVLVPAASLPLDLVPLLALRLAQGAGSALLLCAGWSLLRRLFGEARLGLGLGSAELAALPALLLVQMGAGFALSFLGSLGILVPTLILALPSLILGLVALPKDDAPRPRFDGLGAVLSVLCLGLLLAAVPLAVIRPVAALLVLNLGLMLSALWIWQQWRRPAPLLPLDLLARPQTGWLLAAAFAGNVALTAADTGLLARLSGFAGLSQEGIGFVFLGLAALTAGAGFLAGRSGAPPLARIGMGLTAAGLAALAVGLPGGGTIDAWPIPVAGLVAFGLGRGLFIVANALALLRAAPPERNAAATGLFVLAGGIGTLLGPLYLTQLPALVLPPGAISTELWLGLAAGAAGIAALLSRSGAKTEPHGGRLAREPV
ncbi:MAG TPA: MFS transporter [Methylobacterium sp.]|jgi:MFS family permease|uniref:MFS transporter n=1 Tax=Methylorubrum sp. B1-46 TaxID=2897334 RepID=UPI001E5290AF|nr:MFS transporter [Methylorubrum sp. B1-46]UGB25493.1 MFS transporter [Methylorubrum sp. B1-46]HEV2545071.1 MFS transporter [Methylobacterium sp.]